MGTISQKNGFESARRPVPTRSAHTKQINKRMKKKDSVVHPFLYTLLTHTTSHTLFTHTQKKKKNTCNGCFVFVLSNRHIYIYIFVAFFSPFVG